MSKYWFMLMLVLLVSVNVFGQSNGDQINLSGWDDGATGYGQTMNGQYVYDSSLGCYAQVLGNYIVVNDRVDFDGPTWAIYHATAGVPDGMMPQAYASVPNVALSAVSWLVVVYTGVPGSVAFPPSSAPSPITAAAVDGVGTALGGGGVILGVVLGIAVLFLIFAIVKRALGR